MSDTKIQRGVQDIFFFFLVKLLHFTFFNLCLNLLFSSNPGHPFSAGITLEKLSAVTVDDSGKETFVTGGALDRIQKVLLLFLVEYNLM